MQERRTTRRYKLTLPIRVRTIPACAEGDFFQGDVHDISTGGVYFTIDKRFTEDEVLDFLLAFHGLTQAPEVLVTGRARVLRVVEKPSELSGIAAIIETFHIVGPGST